MAIALEEASQMNLSLPGLALAHQLYNALKAQGGSIGDSICEDDKMELALEILEKAAAKKQGTN